MNYKDFLNNLLKGEHGNKYKNLIVIFLIGLLLLITASFFKGTSKDTSATKKTSDSLSTVDNATIAQNAYEEKVKNELKNILSKIEGVGAIDVMITFEAGEEEVPAINATESSSTTQNGNKEDKTTTSQGNSTNSIVVTNEADGSSKPLILKTNKPKACGVLVVAEGAEANITQLRITKAVMDLLNVQDGKVNVCPMKK